VSKADNLQMYTDFLRAEGYVPQIDQDGDIVFKVEGGMYLILLDEKDDQFFRLIYPNFWSIESPNERIKVEKAALVATGNTKVAKVFPVGNNVWGAIEMFAASPEAIKPVFARALSALRTAVNSFKEEMHK